MNLELCRHCQSPFLAEQKHCPRCGADYEWNADSYANAGCLILMMLLAFGMIMMPILLCAGMFF